MNFSVVSVLILILAPISAFAGKVGTPNPNIPHEPGINEVVKIKYTKGIWGSIRKPNSAPNREIVKVIPVSVQAFEHLSKLDKSAEYECTIKASTLDESGEDIYFENILKIYYVVDIDCG